MSLRGLPAPINFAAGLLDWGGIAWRDRIAAMRLATPIREQKSRIDSGVYPRRRSPVIVGIRGSSQPETWFCCTSWSNFRLLITV